MSKKNNIILAFFCIFLTNCVVTTPKGYAHSIKPPTISYVKVVSNTKVKFCKDKKCEIRSLFHTGSGMTINIVKNTNTVITAGHVCDGAYEGQVNTTIKVLDHNSELHAAWVIFISQHTKDTSDLCILYVPTLKNKKINFSLRKPKIGDELYYIGSPLGVYHPPVVPVFKGTYSGTLDKSSSMVTMPVAGGASGSAVFNDKNQIVGIIFAANPRFEHISLMSNHETFINFLLEARKIIIKANSTQ